jgi:hypothetical protein
MVRARRVKQPCIVRCNIVAFATLLGYDRPVNRNEAERALSAWASVERDDLVRAAYEAGVSKNRIHILTGIARTTIDRILETSMTHDQQRRLAAYLTTFIADWPREDFYSAFPWGVTPSLASEQYTVREIADMLLGDVAFQALKLGTFLNTPDGKVLAGAVESLTPPPYREDLQLLVEALQVAANLQQEKAREAVMKAVAVVVGVGVAAAVLGNNG